MSRRKKYVRVNNHVVFKVERLMAHFDVCQNTASNWVNQGLKPSDQKRPFVFQGAEINRFLDTRRISSSKKLRLGQFKCFGCNNRVFPDPTLLEIFVTKQSKFSVSASCPECNRIVHKIINETDCNKFKRCRDTKISLASLDEDESQAKAEIGICDLQAEGPRYYLNDRVIARWQEFGGQFEPSTRLAYLASIRDFEAFMGGKPFEQIAEADVAQYREHLKDRARAEDETHLIRSTVKHRASQLKKFFIWFAETYPKSGVSNAVANNFMLPKKFNYSTVTERTKNPPTHDQATQLLREMPTQEIILRRDRAMVAVAFGFALRADTVTTLRLKHVDLEKKTVLQDGAVSRTKNGKSLLVRKFPLDQLFFEVLKSWAEEMIALGLRPDDALFPSVEGLASRAWLRSEISLNPMKSTGAISAAFASASERVGRHWTPHDAKHCIGKLMLIMCKTPEQMKAWSLNMGHNSVETTLNYYGTVPDGRVAYIFENFDDSLEPTDNNALVKDLLSVVAKHQRPSDLLPFESANLG